LPVLPVALLFQSLQSFHGLKGQNAFVTLGLFSASDNAGKAQGATCVRSQQVDLL
jgi:hypothetical protein